MNDDSSTEFLRAATIAEKWVRWINEASRESAPIHLVTDLDVGSGHAKFAVEVTYDKRKVTTVLRGDFLDNDTLETSSILVSMSKKYIAHTDGTVP